MFADDAGFGQFLTLRLVQRDDDDLIGAVAVCAQMSPQSNDLIYLLHIIDAELVVGLAESAHVVPADGADAAAVGTAQNAVVEERTDHVAQMFDHAILSRQHALTNLQQASGVPVAREHVRAEGGLIGQIEDAVGGHAPLGGDVAAQLLRVAEQNHFRQLIHGAKK